MTESQAIQTSVMVTGKIGAGKSTVTRFLCEEFGFGVVGFGATVRAKAKELGLGSDRRTLQDVGHDLISRLGEPALVNMAIAYSELASRGRVAFDGIRNAAAEEYTRSLAEATYLIFVDLDDERRRSRILERTQGEPLTSEALIEMEKHPIESGIDALRSRAELVVSNDGTPAQLLEEVKRFLLSRGITKPR